MRFRAFAVAGRKVASTARVFRRPMLRCRDLGFRGVASVDLYRPVDDGNNWLAARARVSGHPCWLPRTPPTSGMETARRALHHRRERQEGVARGNYPSPRWVSGNAGGVARRDRGRVRSWRPGPSRHAAHAQRDGVPPPLGRAVHGLDAIRAAVAPIVALRPRLTSTVLGKVERRRPRAHARALGALRQWSGRDPVRTARPRDHRLPAAARWHLADRDRQSHDTRVNDPRVRHATIG
jgi:hypothetical protein